MTASPAVRAVLRESLVAADRECATWALVIGGTASSADLRATELRTLPPHVARALDAFRLALHLDAVHAVGEPGDGERE